MGTFFPLGRGVYTPKLPKNFADFSEKFFTTWKKLPYPPAYMPEGVEVLGQGRLYGDANDAFASGPPGKFK
jgi:hypothetical protein